MLRTHIAMGLAFAFLTGAALAAQQESRKQKEPPEHMEGIIKATDHKDPRALLYVTVTVKERQPTAEEDILRVIDKDYRFQINAETKIFGIDGKPEPRGIKSLQDGVRVEIKFKDQSALEVKILPPM